MSKEMEGAVEWRPEWSGEQLEHFNRLRAAYSREISVMRELRKALGMSQVEIAEILNMTQSNVSKLEVRGDPSLSILRRMVEAKGGKLSLKFTAPDGQERAIAL